MLSAAEELDRVAALCARLDVELPEQDLPGRVLEPIAALVGAETACLRRFGVVQGEPAPVSIVDLGIPSSVRTTYVEQYFALDPIRPLLARHLASPVFADPTRRGEWLGEHAPSAKRVAHDDEFRRYRREFLLPNRFHHHLGFYVPISGREMLAFDFHRAESAPEFDLLARARARVIAGYLHATAGGRRFRAAGRESGFADVALTQREAEVAEDVTAGLSNKQISENLRISVRTVENHLRSIFAKHGVSTRTQLAAVRRRATGR